MVYISIYIRTHLGEWVCVLVRACVRVYECVRMYVWIYIQPIADSVAQNLEIVSKNFPFSTRRTRILMGVIIRTVVMRY